MRLTGGYRRVQVETHYNSHYSSLPLKPSNGESRFTARRADATHADTTLTSSPH